jgi:nucleoid-associated protein YgaU
MPEPLNLTKAELIELKPDLSAEQPGGKRLVVQFNPDSLKVSFSNQIVKPEAGGSQKGTAGLLFVGEGATKLAVQLWFDVTRMENSETRDVRDITQNLASFMKPGLKQKEGQFTPHPVRFKWGGFTFDGIIESMEETLDYWSNDGRPLRASVALNLAQQKIDALDRPNTAQASATKLASLIGDAAGATAGNPPGTTPLTPSTAGATLQDLAQRAGRGDWQSIAAANGIENPRLLQPGQLLNLNPVIRIGT